MASLRFEVRGHDESEGASGRPRAVRHPHRHPGRDRRNGEDKYAGLSPSAGVDQMKNARARRVLTALLRGTKGGRPLSTRWSRQGPSSLRITSRAASSAGAGAVLCTVQGVFALVG